MEIIDDMSFLLRARFKKDIVAEFLPPKDMSSRRVVILCSGMPSGPSSEKVVRFLAKKNFWVFHPRYRGTWESGGEFLGHDPTQDIFDVIDELPGGFTSIWDGTEYSVAPEEVYVIGSSFGGPAAILSTLDPRVSRGIAISPVVDWQVEKNSEEEPMEWLERVVRDSFGEAYRFSHENWLRLYEGGVYNPVGKIGDLDKNKIMIIHAEDDTVVSTPSVKSFVQRLGCEALMKKNGGHFSTSKIMEWRVWRRVKKFMVPG